MRTRLKQVALALTLTALTCAPAAGFAANPAAPQGQMQTAPNAVGQEKHPVMRKAIAQLQRTREELQNDASRDFDGHRANAVKLIDQAIQQLQLGIQSDKH